MNTIHGVNRAEICSRLRGRGLGRRFGKLFLVAIRLRGHFNRKRKWLGALGNHGSLRGNLHGDLNDSHPGGRLPRS